MPPSIPAPPTVVSLKQDFLSTQTRLLSQPLTPSRAWRASNDANEDDNEGDNEDDQGALPDKVIDDALWGLNHRLQQHAKRVYSRRATRHIAEQIDQLYWDATNGSEREDAGDENGEGARELTIDADLVDPKLITTLPPTWDFSPSAKRQSSSNPAEATRYTELVTALQSLSTRQKESSERVARLRRMQCLLEPFSPTQEDETDQPQLQDNLVTRNGQIESELQRMRMLLVRVGGRVDQLQQQKERGKGKQRRGKRARQDEGDGDDARMTDVVNLDSGLDERRKFDDLMQSLQ